MEPHCGLYVVAFPPYFFITLVSKKPILESLGIHRNVGKFSFNVIHFFLFINDYFFVVFNLVFLESYPWYRLTY